MKGKKESSLEKEDDKKSLSKDDKKSLNKDDKKSLSKDDKKLLGKVLDDWTKCGNQKCSHIISKKKIKEEGKKWGQFIKKECPLELKDHSTHNKENMQKIKKFTKCYKKHEKNSAYVQKLTKRMKCAYQKCKNEKNKMGEIIDKLYSSFSLPPPPSANKTVKKSAKSKSVANSKSSASKK
jgi:hypothetical protein